MIIERATQKRGKMRGELETRALPGNDETLGSQVRLDGVGAIYATAFDVVRDDPGFLAVFVHDSKNRIVGHLTINSDRIIIDTGDDYVLMPSTVVQGSKYSRFEFSKKRGK